MREPAWPPLAWFKDADRGLVRPLQGPCRRRGGDAALPENPDEAYADSAYRGEILGAALRARGGTPRTLHRHAGAP